MLQNFSNILTYTMRLLKPRQNEDMATSPCFTWWLWQLKTRSSHIPRMKEDTKTRVTETLFYIQFQGLCLKVWVCKDYLWARKVQEMKLSYYIRLRSFLDSVQKVHSQKLLKVKDKSIYHLPEPQEPVLAGFRKASELINFNTCAVITLKSYFRLLRFEWHQMAYLWQNIKRQETTRPLCTPYLDGTCWLNMYRTHEKLPVLPLSRTSPRQAHYSSTVFVQN